MLSRYNSHQNPIDLLHSTDLMHMARTGRAEMGIRGSLQKLSVLATVGTVCTVCAHFTRLNYLTPLLNNS
ncbi:hypothetical protein C0J52_02097 [Blattella germanica]|nr:hypothetical protein C0J52_02097 [Blattella germanica]